MKATLANAASQCRGIIRSHLLRSSLLLAGGLIAAATPAFAQSSNNLCIKEKVGGNPPCTANDVRIGNLKVIAGPTTCDPSDPTPFQVTLEATIESGPDRYDIGLWLNTDGGSALSDPSGPNCYRDYLHPLGTMTVCQQQGGPYYNADSDNCGDVYAQNTNPCGNAVTGPCTGGSGGTCLFSTYQFTTMITCTDSNADNIVDAGTCTSWDNNAGSVCANELTTDPGTGSKCNCTRADIVGLTVPSTTTSTSEPPPTTTTTSEPPPTTTSTSEPPPTTTSTSTSTTTSTIPLCGNGVLDGSEECDPPGSITCPAGSPGGAFLPCSQICTCCVPSPEICNDQIDNDCDGLVDCDDEDSCPQPCPVIQKDPSTIRFGNDGALDIFKSHGRVEPGETIDMTTSDVGWVLSNQRGVIWSGTLSPSDFIANATSTTFRYKNIAAKTAGGIYKAKVRITRGGTSYGFKVQAYGDLSAATDPQMSIQFYLGTTPKAYIHSEPWTRTKTGWKADGFQ